MAITSDTFTKSNNAALGVSSSGHTWQTITGTGEVYSQRGRHASVGTNGNAIFVLDNGTNGQNAVIQIDAPATYYKGGYAIYFRVQDANNYMVAYLHFYDYTFPSGTVQVFDHYDPRYVQVFDHYDQVPTGTNYCTTVKYILVNPVSGAQVVPEYSHYDTKCNSAPGSWFPAVSEFPEQPSDVPGDVGHVYRAFFDHYDSTAIYTEVPVYRTEVIYDIPVYRDEVVYSTAYSCNAVLARRIAGVKTILQTAPVTMPVTTLRVNANGAAIQVYTNGIVRINVSDASFSDRTKHGWGFNGDAVGGVGSYPNTDGVDNYSATPYTAPNAPVLASPANNSSAELTTTGPTYTWTHSDPEGDPQTSWALRRRLAGTSTYEWWSAAGLAWQSVEIFNSGSSGSYTFPANKWSAGNNYYWTVRTSDATVGAGPYATEFYVIARANPLPPTPTYPANNTYLDLAAGALFSWVFADLNDGDTQSAYAFRRKISGAGSYEWWNGTTWQGTQVFVTSTTSSVTFAANKWTNGNTYNWSVNTKDQGGLAGATYSGDLTVIASSPPVIALTAPPANVIDAQPVVTWTYTDPEPQASYSVKIFTAAQYGAGGFNPATSTAFVESGLVVSASTRTWTPTVDLTNLTTYRAYVQVSQVGGQSSAWTYTTFTLTLDVPAVPSLIVTFDNVLARFLIAIQGHDNLLNVDQASLEDTSAGWTANLNCAVVRSTTQSANGTASLRLTSTAAGTMSASLPTGISGVAVIPSLEYTVLASFRTAASGRSCRVDVFWWKSNGTASTVRASDSSTVVTDTTAAFVQKALTVTSPSDAMFASIVVVVQSAGGAGEVHYVDKISIAPGASTIWTRGGLAGAGTPVVESSPDDVTFTPIRRASSTVWAMPSQQLLVYDYEFPVTATKTVYYRVKNEVAVTIEDPSQVVPVANGSLSLSGSAASNTVGRTATGSLSLSASSVTASGGSGGTFRTVDTMVYAKFGAPLRTDQITYPNWGRHEYPIPVSPGFDWYEGAKASVDVASYPSGQWTHHNTWGQAICDTAGTAERRVRLQVAEQQVWHLVNGAWVSKMNDASAGSIDGGFYTGSFTGGTQNFAATARSESEGFSINLLPCTNSDGSPNATNTFAHWWYAGTYPRIALASGTTAVAIVCKMRLITDTAGVNVNDAHFTACFSGDVYTSATDAGNNANAGFNIPRHQRLTGDWKALGMVTGTEAQIRAYPPMPFLSGSSAPGARTATGSLSLSGSVTAGGGGGGGTTRDKYSWPFTQDSIWNTPIGTGATYAEAGFAAANDWYGQVLTDEEHIGLNPADGLKTLHVTASPYAGNGAQVRVPSSMEHNGDGNSCAAFLDQDNNRVWQGQYLTLTQNGDPYWDWTIPTTPYDLQTGDGRMGNHGGSHLSILGGSIRPGELTSSDPIHHALKLNVYGWKYLYKGATAADCWRWPAYNCDAAWSAGSEPDGYNSSNVNLKMGALLALEPAYDLTWITDSRVLKIATALRNYGAYIVDNSAWNVYAFSVDIVAKNLGEFPVSGTSSIDTTFHSQLMTVITNLHVVSNNDATHVGGGGSPRFASLAPPFE